MLITHDLFSSSQGIFGIVILTLRDRDAQATATAPRGSSEATRDLGTPYLLAEPRCAEKVCGRLTRHSREVRVTILL